MSNAVDIVIEMICILTALYVAECILRKIYYARTTRFFESYPMYPSLLLTRYCHIVD